MRHHTAMRSGTDIEKAQHRLLGMGGHIRQHTLMRNTLPWVGNAAQKKQASNTITGALLDPRPHLVPHIPKGNQTNASTLTCKCRQQAHSSAAAEARKLTQMVVLLTPQVHSKSSITYPHLPTQPDTSHFAVIPRPPFAHAPDTLRLQSPSPCCSFSSQFCWTDVPCSSHAAWLHSLLLLPRIMAAHSAARPQKGPSLVHHPSHRGGRCCCSIAALNRCCLPQDGLVQRCAGQAMDVVDLHGDAQRDL